MIAKLLGGLLGLHAGFVMSAAVDLNQVFGAALESSPSLNIARQQLNVGLAQKDQTTGRLLPQISLSATWSENHRWNEDTGSIFSPTPEFQQYKGERYNMSLRQALFNWQGFAARQRAGVVVDQREAEYFDALAMLMVDVSEKYLDVLEAQDALSSVRSERDATEQQLSQVTQMFERKLAKVTDLYEIQARVAAVQVDEIDADNSVALAKEQLWEVTGMEVDELFALADQVHVPVVDGSVALWVEKALVGNAELKARRLAWDAANKRVSERRGAYLPTLDLVGQAQKSDIGSDNQSSPKYESTYISLDFRMPIYTGGSNSAGVREARGQAEIARNEYERLRREVTRRARAAYLNVQSSFKRTQASRKMVAFTARASIAMRKGYGYGTVTSVDVLNALRDEHAAMRDLQAARYAHIKALMYLKREAGSISNNDLNEINSWLIEPELEPVGSAASLNGLRLSIGADA